MFLFSFALQLIKTCMLYVVPMLYLSLLAFYKFYISSIWHSRNKIQNTSMQLSPNRWKAAFDTFAGWNNFAMTNFLKKETRFRNITYSSNMIRTFQIRVIRISNVFSILQGFSIKLRWLQIKLLSAIKQL